ncbi:SRPBCC family protein [Pseudonocardia ailaonensis]|uniref:SRPBCC family protein n=1 Tax=Pseudonocardia ailaonensis TaxID=367279 RepID=A0ABN2NN95_9PSEU
MDETSVEVDATPAQAWALISDITRVGEWSPECTGGAWKGGATGPAAGARFVGRNRHGRIRWTTHCRVVTCEPERAFAFTVLESAMTWGYRIEPVAGGVRLVQWRDRTGALAVPAKLLAASGILGRDRETMMIDGMRTTLDRIKAELERTPA